MTRIFDHVSLGVSDYAAAKAFYDRILPILGIVLIWEKPGMASYGIGRDDQFGIQQDGADPRPGTHMAFSAPDRTTVDRFHAEALRAGGTDDGAPGLRPYTPTYYAAFARDPSGNRIEAICHAPG